MLYIACFGDSLIEGFPFGRGASWCAAAEAATSGCGARALKLLNYGLCGDCCDDIFDRMRLYRRSLPEYVRHVLFLGGANDILQGTPRRDTLRYVDRMVQWCGEEGLRLCVVLPIISGEEELNRYLYTLREDLYMRLPDSVYALDLQPAIGLEAGERRRAYVDGVHPSCASYRRMGEYAAPLLQQWAEGTQF